MKRPAVFFDRDNTLIQNDGFLGDPALVVLVEGAAAAVARARGMGYATVTISNQSGVARGLFEEEDVQRVNARMDDLLKADHPQAVFERHEFCPFHPDGNIDVYRRESERRKPAPGMILSAAQKLDLDLAASWVIGDAARDMQAGRAAGCRTILLRRPGMQETDPDLHDEADFTTDSLQEALDLIEQNSQRSSAAASSASTSATDKPWLVAAQQAKAAKSAAATPPPPPAPPVAPAGAEAAAPPGTAQDSGPGTARLPHETNASAHLPEEPGGPPPDAAAAPEQAAAAPPPASSTHLEHLSQQLLGELRRRHEQDHADFSVTKLLAGIVQVMALAAVLLAYLHGKENYNFLLTAIYLQTLTIALLIMGRQR